MPSLPERLQALQKLLAPYAVPLSGELGREFPEPADESRFPFQRDRDRLIHTQSFRRLQGKTQVFVAGEGDHYRTRLTHTMEVAQIARDMARTLSLNEDLAECIALAHDFGHPPFGHAGEEALDMWMKKHGSAFEHNQQTLRIVTVLEEHTPEHPGLNLNREVLEGLQKHREDPSAQKLPRGLSLEAQVVNTADEIAYTGHDCDDGLRAGLFTLDDVCAVPLGKDAYAKAKKRGTSVRGALIHLLTDDLYKTTSRMLEEKSIGSLGDVYAHRAPLVIFSAGMEEKLKTFRAFLWKRMYLHESVQKHNDEGQRIVMTLCDRYLQSPHEKIIELQKRTNGTLANAVKDYVAGMTDGYAKVLAAELS